MNREQTLIASDKILRGSLILYVLAMTIPPIPAIRSCLIIVCLLCLILRGILTRRFPLRTTPLDLPILLYAAIIVFKSVTSIDPSYSLSALRKELLYQMAFYYITVSAMDSPKYTRRIMLMLMITVTLVAGIGLSGYLSGDMIKEGRATSFLGSFGRAAFFTAMVMPIALSRFLCTRGWRRSVGVGCPDPVSGFHAGNDVARRLDQQPSGCLDAGGTEGPADARPALDRSPVCSVDPSSRYHHESNQCHPNYETR